MTHKLLELKFRKNGFNFEQIKRKGDTAIYKMWKSPEHPCFEVIKINRHNGYTLGGVTIEPAETYPSSSSWGLPNGGWSYRTLEEAEVRFKKLI